MYVNTDPLWECEETIVVLPVSAALVLVFMLRKKELIIELARDMKNCKEQILQLRVVLCNLFIVYPQIPFGQRVEREFPAVRSC